MLKPKRILLLSAALLLWMAGCSPETMDNVEIDPPKRGLLHELEHHRHHHDHHHE